MSIVVPAYEEAASLPELAEPDVVRHYTNLSTLNMSVDTHFYPLGSCTMKHNPKRNERLASLPGMLHVHPYQSEDSMQGLLELLYGLQEMLAEISGLPAVSLQPAAQVDLLSLLTGDVLSVSRNDLAVRPRGAAHQSPHARQRSRH